MFLTNEEIAAIAQWQPICPGFGRDDTQTSARVLAIKDRINASGEFGCELVFDDGLANYFTLFSYLVADVPSYALARSVEGLLIYLSACGPVGVAGRSRKCVGEGILTHDPLRYDAVHMILVAAPLYNPVLKCLGTLPSAMTAEDSATKETYISLGRVKVSESTLALLLNCFLSGQLKAL